MRIVKKNNLEFKIFKTEEDACKSIADRIIEIINTKSNGANQTANIGLATGKSPLSVYKHLVKSYQETK